MAIHRHPPALTRQTTVSDDRRRSMWRHVRQQVEIDLGAVGKRESLPIGVHSRDLVFRVVRNTLRGEQLYHRAGDVGPSDAHWRRLGGVEFDLHAIAKALSA